MQIFEELTKRQLIAQITNEEEVKNLINSGKARCYRHGQKQGVPELGHYARARDKSFRVALRQRFLRRVYEICNCNGNVGSWKIIRSQDA